MVGVTLALRSKVGCDLQIEILLSKNRWTNPSIFYLELTMPNKDLYKIYEEVLHNWLLLKVFWLNLQEAFFLEI